MQSGKFVKLVKRLQSATLNGSQAVFKVGLIVCSHYLMTAYQHALTSFRIVINHQGLLCTILCTRE